MNRDPQAGPQIHGLILAAGASRRMGTPKALLLLDGETFLDRLIRLFSPVCQSVIVVVGHDAGRVRMGTARSGEAVFVTNPEPDRGMLSSLQCGIRAVPPRACGILFTPVDHAAIQLDTVQKLGAAFGQGSSDVVIPLFEGRHGHPVLISREVASDILTAPAEATARDVIHGRESREVPVEDPGVVMDADDPGDYEKLLALIRKGAA